METVSETNICSDVKTKCLGNRLEKGITCSKTIQNNVLLPFRMMF